MCQCILIIMMRMSLPAQMQNKPIIVIAAISSRPYVKAAVDAGFLVVAIDSFLDQDTQALATECFYVPFQHYQFDQASMLNAISTTIKSYGRDALVGVCYGAGFEGQPNLIAEIQKQLPLLGNQPNTVLQCKDPNQFQQFCQQHGFVTPAISMDKPILPKGWLVKTQGASGGGHIMFAERHAGAVDADQYFQQFHHGLPVSCLFLANESGASVIGINEQWVTAKTDAPFQYGGAASQLKISDSVLEEFKRFIALATLHFGLKGLNSVDALLEDGQLVYLEINPRLSATMDLYATQEGSLLTSHLAAFQSNNIHFPKLLNEPKAHHIVYATTLINTQIARNWPEWVCDIPDTPQRFEVGMPICTVISNANTTQAAKKLARIRAASLKQ